MHSKLLIGANSLVLLSSQDNVAYHTTLCLDPVLSVMGFFWPFSRLLWVSDLDVCECVVP